MHPLPVSRVSSEILRGRFLESSFGAGRDIFTFRSGDVSKDPTELNTAAKMMDLASFFFLLSKEMLQCSAGSLKRRRKL